VHRNLPQSLNLWHNGRLIVSSPGNTGVPAAPTQLGTFPVFEHIPIGTMSGTNPDRSHYHDPGIRYISYFHEGDAIHAFNRASFGTPQSLGCVELPIAVAAKVWPYTPIGAPDGRERERTRRNTADRDSSSPTPSRKPRDSKDPPQDSSRQARYGRPCRGRALRAVQERQRGTAILTKAQSTTAQSGGAYVNIHTDKNQGGEIRGQLKVSSPNLAADAARPLRSGAPRPQARRLLLERRQTFARGRSPANDSASPPTPASWRSGGVQGASSPS
jgi:hypothetical protein